MTTPTTPEVQPQHISCSMCRKEIPPDAALTPEGADYVGYFCGIECYEAFAAQKTPGAPNQSRKPA